MGSSQNKPLSPSVDNGVLMNQQVLVSVDQTPIPVNLLRGNYLVVGVYLIVFLLFVKILLFLRKEHLKSLKKKYLGRSRLNLNQSV